MAEPPNEELKGTEQLFEQLNKLAPETGDALKATFSGPLGTVILLTMALGEAKKQLEEFNQELDAEGFRASASATGGLQNRQAAWDAARASLGAYQASLEAAGRDPDPTTTWITQLRKLNEMNSASGKTDEVAELKQELAISEAAAPMLAKAAGDAVPATVAGQAAVDDERQKLKDLRVANDPKAGAGTGPSGYITQGDVDDLQAAAEYGRLLMSQVHPKKDSGLQATQDKLEKDLADANQKLTAQRTLQAQIEAGETETSKAKAEADQTILNARAAELANRSRINVLPGEIELAEKAASFGNPGGAGTPFSGHDISGTAVRITAEAVEALQQQQASQLQLARAVRDFANQNRELYGLLAGEFSSLQSTVAETKRQLEMVSAQITNAASHSLSQ